MTPWKSCQDRHEALLALVLGELDPQEAQELEEHLAACEACRRTRQQLEAEEQEVQAGFGLLAQALASVPQALREGVSEEPFASTACHEISHHGPWQRVQTMITRHKSIWTAMAAALAACLLLYFTVHSPARMAYALEQTVQANEQITSYHIKSTPGKGSIGEAWLECDAQGNLLHLRMDFPDTEDGSKVVVGTLDRIDVWFLTKQGHAIIRDPEALQGFMKQREIFDPKLAFEQLQAAEKAGQTTVVTQEPAKAGDPIVLTSTSPGKPDFKSVYSVNPETKLVMQLEKFQRQDGQWISQGAIEYLDYNQPIDPQVFQYQMAGEVATADFINTLWGLPQGTLSDNEIVQQVAREFFEALIAKDYAKASSVTEGVPADLLKQGFEKHGLTFLRIVEIGEPVPHDDPATRFLKVPAQVEIEVDGQKQVAPFHPLIRRTPNDKNRWAIGGGI